MQVTIRVLQIDGQPEIRINPLSGGAGYQRYDLTPQQLLNLSQDALKTYSEVINAPKRNA